MRKRFLIPMAATFGLAVAVLPAVAVSETSQTVEATNIPGSGLYSEEHHAWSPSQVTVTEGDVVTFQNPGAIPHGVEWVSDPAKPTCSSGVPVGTSGEASASGTKWSGTCTFAKPGSYLFYCTVHGPEMTGRIIVNANGTTTVTTPGMTPTSPGVTPVAPPSSPGELGSGPASGPLLMGGASKAIKLAASQHGKLVHGSVEVSQAAVGGRLEVDLLASGSLAKTGRSARVRVGRLVRSSLSAGAVSFEVALSARARHALRARRRLTLTVELVLTPLHGAAVRADRAVVMRP